MMDDPTEQFINSGFPPYPSSVPSPYGAAFDQMKRAQDSIGGPETIKKARQYSPAAMSAGPSAHNNNGYPSANLNANGYEQSQQQGFYGNNVQQAPNGVYNPSNVGMPNGNVSPAGLTIPGPAMQNGVAYNNGQAPASPNSSNGQNGFNMPQYFAAQQQQQAQAQAQAQQQLYNSMGGMMSPMFGGMPMGMPFGFPQMATSFPQFGLNGTMNPAQAAAAAAVGNQTGRTVYVGNLPADASVDELLNLVHFGPLESVRVLPEKSCVFISFLDGATAAGFHADATNKKLALHGQELKIGWGKASPVPSQVMLSITQSNASRNVYLGGLDEHLTEEKLRDDLGRFGLIDQVKIVRDKNIGFIHFLSISVATKVVATLPTEPLWAGKRVNYGKDRCAYVPKSQQPSGAPNHTPHVAQAQLNALNVMSSVFPPMSPFPAAAFPGGMPGFDSPTSPAFAAMAVAGQQLNRTVYLGNIHPETNTEDLCNAIRGGVIQSIRYMQDKHIAFVTFVDAAAAYTFHQVATYQGLTLNNRRLKVGWGKNSGPISPALALSIHAGATRNVYVGNIEDFETFTEEKLKTDFGEYGDIELVNFLKEKNCAFVNFTNISNAIKAIDAIKNKTGYDSLRIAHGKDRCANAPRSGPQGGGGNARRNASGMGGQSPTQTADLEGGDEIPVDEGAEDTAVPIAVDAV